MMRACLSTHQACDRYWTFRKNLISMCCQPVRRSLHSGFLQKGLVCEAGLAIGMTRTRVIFGSALAGGLYGTERDLSKNARCGFILSGALVGSVRLHHIYRLRGKPSKILTSAMQFVLTCEFVESVWWKLKLCFFPSMESRCDSVYWGP